MSSTLPRRSRSIARPVASLKIAIGSDARRFGALDRGRDFGEGAGGEAPQALEGGECLGHGLLSY